ncbi:MAG: hypothetical protein NVSMB64_01930 [Candidatus Velthaea sp.]
MDMRQRFFQTWYDGLVVFDRSLKIVCANDAASRAYGASAGTLVGTSNGDHTSRTADELDPMIRCAFAEGRSVAPRLYPFDENDPMRVVVRRDGDIVYLLLHRLADDIWTVEDPRLRELDMANQLLTFHTENSPLAVIRWDADFRVVGWSPRAEAMFGWRFVDVYGKSMDEIGFVYRLDRERVAEIASEIAAGGVDGNFIENRNVTKNGVVIHCRWFNSHVRLSAGYGVLSLVEDITESVLARHAASESEQRFRSLFEYSPDPTLSLSLDGAITRANAAAAIALGCGADAIVGRPIVDFIASHDVARASAALANAADGEAGSAELIALRRSGTFPIAASFIPIVLEDRITGVHLVARDVTDEKRAEREIAAQAERIRELYLVSAAANATAERQIQATIEAGCRLLGVAAGGLYESESGRLVSSVGSGLPARFARLAIATDGALALDDVRGVPYLDAGDTDEPRISSFIGTPIDVSGNRYGSLCFADPAPRPDLYRAVDRDLIQLMGALIGSALERSRARAHLKYLAYNDQLTSLPNRASFVERLKDEITAAAEHGESIGVMFLDLDRFKDINDTLGHALGDRLLRIVGDRLRGAIRDSGVVARMGGDEFIIMIGGNPDPEALAAIADRVVHCIDQPVEMQGYEQYVTTSVGIAVYPANGGDADTLIKHADIAMYRAKERGRNTYHFFTPALNATLRSRLSQEKNLRKALEREEFVVYYQPQVDLETDCIVGVEALVRWQHPRLGLVPPDQFIPSAELSGLIVALGDWVLESACTQVREWQQGGYPDLHLAVNLSARQFHQTHLASKVRAALTRTGLAPGTLEVEITESVAMNDAALSVAIMQDLGNAGVRLSVDDFGTGYSSLGYLRRFPLHSIKIDQSFVRDIMTEPDDATIVRTVIAMAHSLGLEVCAEGVETADQLDFLRRERCDRVQGYYISRPMTAADLAPILTRYRHSAARASSM